MGNCKDCQHWNIESNWIYEFDNEGDFVKNEKRGVCTLTESENGNAVNAETKAFAKDAEGYFAKLITDFDFGCIQYVKHSP